MKNFMSMVLLFGISFLSFAQKGCITGNTTIILNQTNVFTANFPGQCASCYDWDINGNNTSSDNNVVGTVQIVNSDMGNTVSIKGIATGPFTIQLTYFDETGCHNCSISGTVVPPPCDFTVSVSPNYTYSTGVTPPTATLTAVTTPNLTSGVTYYWTVTYQDGSTATYTGTTNQATFTASFTNPIVSASVYATYLTCNSTGGSSFTGPVFGVVSLPSQTCFGFDPPPGPGDTNVDGTLNQGFIGSYVGTSIPSVGLTFTWYYKFQNPSTPLLVLDGQNAQFREKCPTNPVMSFACRVSNGVQTKDYKSLVSGYPIPTFSGANSPTCFMHPSCSLQRNSNQQGTIKVSPNPTKSLINFDGADLEKFNITIYDQNGHVIVKNQKINKSISIENQKKGVYFYTITDQSEYKQEGKIIKE